MNRRQISIAVRNPDVARVGVARIECPRSSAMSSVEARKGTVR